jgi:hypothetical protein
MSLTTLKSLKRVEFDFLLWQDRYLSTAMAWSARTLRRYHSIFDVKDQ